MRTQIVEALALRLAPQEQERFLNAGTNAVSAYDLLLQGRHYEASLDRVSVTRPITLYRRALDVDPGYTDARRDNQDEIRKSAIVLKSGVKWRSN